MPHRLKKEVNGCGSEKWVGAGLNFRTARRPTGGAWTAMSNLKACVDQRVLSSQVLLCAQAVHEMKARGPPQSQRAERAQGKYLSSIGEALQEIQKRMDASASEIKGGGGSKYVANRKAAANKRTAQKQQDELPSSSACDQVHGWVQDLKLASKRKVDEGELPTPKRAARGEENTDDQGIDVSTGRSMGHGCERISHRPYAGFFHHGQRGTKVRRVE